MTEISLRYDIGNTLEERDHYTPDAVECRGPEPGELECHAPEQPPPRAPEPPTPGTEQLVRAFARARSAPDDTETGNRMGQKVCSLGTSAVIPNPGALLGLLGCAMVLNPARDAAAPEVGNARGATGTGGKDYAPPSGTGGVSGK